MICVSQKYEWNLRIEVSEGEQSLRHPCKSDAVVILANISAGLFHLLRADLNAVLSLKTETTAPHRPSVRASIFPVLRFFFALFASASRGLAHAFCILGPFSERRFPIPLTRPCAMRTLHPRGTTHGGHDDAFSFRTYFNTLQLPAQPSGINSDTPRTRNHAKCSALLRLGTE